MLKLEELTIEYNYWGEHKGEYVATVKLKDKDNTIKVVLNPQISSSLIPLVRDEICKAASNYASELNKKLLEIV